MDTLFWNTNLRTDHHTRPTPEPSAAAATSTTGSSNDAAAGSGGALGGPAPPPPPIKAPLSEVDLVFSAGLVALGLRGNLITEAGLGALRRAVRSNHWVIGVDVAFNQVSHDGLTLLVESLIQAENRAMHALLIDGNPGYLPPPPLLTYQPAPLCEGGGGGGDDHVGENGEGGGGEVGVKAHYMGDFVAAERPTPVSVPLRDGITSKVPRPIAPFLGPYLYPCLDPYLGLFHVHCISPHFTRCLIPVYYSHPRRRSDWSTCRRRWPRCCGGGCSSR